MGTNRKAIRKLLAQKIESSIVGTGKRTRAVYHYKPALFDRGTPAVCVASMPSDRKVEAISVVRTDAFYFDIHTFVLYTGKDWTPEMSEDALDDIELDVTNAIAEHASADEWAYMRLIDRPIMDPVLINGVEYQHEVFQVEIRLHSQ